MKTKKVLLSNSLRQVQEFKDDFQREIPLFDKLNTIAKSNDLFLSPTIANDYLQKHTEDQPTFLPMKVLEMKGLDSTYKSILDLVSKLKYLSFHLDDIALQSHIDSFKAYTEDSKTIEIVEHIRSIAKISKALGMSNGYIDEYLRSYGYRTASDDFIVHVIRDKIYPYVIGVEQTKIVL